MGLKIRDTIRTHQIGPKTDPCLAAVAFTVELVESELKKVRSAESILTAMDEHGTRGGQRKIADREYRKAQRRYEAACRLKYLALADYDHLVVIRQTETPPDAPQSPVVVSGDVLTPITPDRINIYVDDLTSDPDDVHSLKLHIIEA